MNRAIYVTLTVTLLVAALALFLWSSRTTAKCAAGCRLLTTEREVIENQYQICQCGEARR